LCYILGAVGVDDKDTIEQFPTGWQHVNGPGAVKLQGKYSKYVILL